MLMRTITCLTGWSMSPLTMLFHLVCEELFRVFLVVSSHSSTVVILLAGANLNALFTGLDFLISYIELSKFIVLQNTFGIDFFCHKRNMSFEPLSTIHMTNSDLLSQMELTDLSLRLYSTRSFLED